ncbi:hypothetical protein [Micromonospora sp. CPCC 206061]|uniref:hypothetical protein n=1 Tax=Micromonospora sp. CPCC 206061 TaxID=3122410 RepID=UPI002FF096A3
MWFSAAIVVAGSVIAAGAAAYGAQTKTAWLVIVIASAAAAVTAGIQPFKSGIDRIRGRVEDRREKLEDLKQQKFLLVNAGRFPRVRDVSDPMRVGVHRAIEGATGQPEYQQRAFDDKLDAVLRRGGVIVVHGPSAAGKSRAAYEAVRRTLPDRFFVMPTVIGALDEVLGLGGHIGDAVIWLDNFNPSIDQSVNNVQALAQRLVPPGRSDVAVVFTMWDDTWRQSWAQSLRGIANDIRIPRNLTAAERERALARSTDPRLRSALSQFEFGLAEYMAAGPRTFDEWQNGRSIDLKAPGVGAAIVCAAVDCWRAGYHRPLSSEVLLRLYTQYLNPVLASHPDLASFDEGLGWATTLVAGASSCLIKDADGGYRPFDYLVDKTQTDPDSPPVPDAVFDQVAALLDEAVAVEVARAALETGRLELADRATRLAVQSSVAKRRGNAIYVLAQVLDARGEHEQAEARYREAADAGDPDALSRLGLKLAADSRSGAATEVFGRATKARTAALALESALRRPRSLDPLELGFTPRPPIPWLAPMLLAGKLVTTMMKLIFGAFLDKRELQNALPSQIFQHDAPDGVGLDYVASVGDGFNATYSVAWTLAQPELTVDGHRLARGDVLVMGGNEVLGFPSRENYEDRCLGPYTAALPTVEGGPEPTLYALPGAGDWEDGQAAFLRVFSAEERIGGWRTRQSRSYFAIKLPAGWWLFGLDTAGGEVDLPQRRYFREAARMLTPQSRVILCLPDATWSRVADDPDAYNSTDLFIRQVIAPTGAGVAVILAGGYHHYSRYEQARTVGPHGTGRQLITCGGGGSYVQGTDRLAAEMDLPPRTTLDRRATPPERFVLRTAYPDRTTSRRLAAGIFGRLPLRNPGLSTLLGVLHALTLLAMIQVAERAGQRQEQPIGGLTVALLLLIMSLAIALANLLPGASTSRRPTPQPWILAICHGLAHIGLAAAGTWVWLQLPFVSWPSPMSAVAALVIYGPVAGFVATLLFAVYLYGAGAYGVNYTELFSGQGHEAARSFLRMRIDADGDLTISAIAIDRPCRQWHAAAKEPAHTPWLQPGEPLQARLIEPPIRIR